MKKGDFVTTRTLLERGYKFNCYFAGFHAYKLLKDGGVIEYLIHDFIKQEVVTVFDSYQN